jgi:uncharacterized protein YggL (DUF469 family)
VSAACPKFGFRVQVSMAFGLSERTIGELWSAFRRDVVDARGLVCERLVDADRWSMTLRSEASQATDGDREAVSEWGGGRSEIEALDVGPLVDLAEVG